MEAAPASGCIRTRAKTLSKTILERSRPSRRHGSIKPQHGQGSNSYKDRLATVTGGPEAQRSLTYRNAQSSAQDQTCKSVLHDSNSSSFINQGLLRWQEQRMEWAGERGERKGDEERKAVLSRETTYEELLMNNRYFPQPIPLPEMVAYLVNVWEEEGLFDHIH